MRYKPPKKYPIACKIPGCLAISPSKKFRGHCPPHYRRQHWIRFGQADDRRRKMKWRARQLAIWLTRNKKPRKNPPPMTPAERRIYEAEVHRLVTLYPPTSQYFYCRLCSRAAMWARGGGREAYQRRCAIEARKAGWRRKWLREGNYDADLLNQLLTAAQPQPKVSGRRTNLHGS